MLGNAGLADARDKREIDQARYKRKMEMEAEKSRYARATSAPNPDCFLWP